MTLCLAGYYHLHALDGQSMATLSCSHSPIANRNCQLRAIACCGEPVSLFPRSIGHECYRSSIVNTVVRMSQRKAIARSYVWWPGMDQAVEAMVKACVACQSVTSAPVAAPLDPWVWPAKPWQQIYINFAGPFRGSMFLVVADAHCKWPEVCELRVTTAAKTIEVFYFPTSFRVEECTIVGTISSCMI